MLVDEGERLTDRLEVDDLSYAQAVAEKLDEKRKTEYLSPVELAQVHVALGNTEKAPDSPGLARLPKSAVVSEVLAFGCHL